MTRHACSDRDAVERPGVALSADRADFPPLRSVATEVAPVADSFSALPAQIEIPRPTRKLSVRVICRRLPGARLRLDGREIAPVCLGVGASGRDPELVYDADRDVIVIDTYLHVARCADDVFDARGPYTGQAHHDRAMLLRWGTRTPGGHFLLFSGLQLRLPQIVANAEPARHGRHAPALSAIIELTDATGGPLRGIVNAAEVAWRLTSRGELGISTVPSAVGRRGVAATTGWAPQ